MGTRNHIRTPISTSFNVFNFKLEIFSNVRKVQLDQERAKQRDRTTSYIPNHNRNFYKKHGFYFYLEFSCHIILAI